MHKAPSDPAPLPCRTGEHAHFLVRPVSHFTQSHGPVCALPGAAFEIAHVAWCQDFLFISNMTNFVGHVRPQTVLKHGWPQLSLAALQQYAMSAMPTTDCQCMLMSLMLLASAPMALVRRLF